MALFISTHESSEVRINSFSHLFFSLFPFFISFCDRSFLIAAIIRQWWWKQSTDELSPHLPSINPCENIVRDSVVPRKEHYRRSNFPDDIFILHFISQRGTIFFSNIIQERSSAGKAHTWKFLWYRDVTMLNHSLYSLQKSSASFFFSSERNDLGL